MIILDENIPKGQRQLLRGWRIRALLIGEDISRKGIQDDQIIPMLHELNRPTFFSRDLGFYRPKLCHVRYCLVCLAGSRYEAASFVRRFLRHPRFNTRAKRMSKVVRLSSAGIRFWQLHAEQESVVPWHP